ncbi:MAG: glycerol-3-phosphate 1-O-acyltransferase PlsY [Clostridia bacterium]|nr:glycerol-3-phosphate 1-O-acyltransferase PlsY [Clostridia bacterium]
MKILLLLISGIMGYLFGSINFAVLIGKIFYKKDVRDYGSGNAGATNVLRVLGKLPAAVVVVCDMLKGVAAFWVAEKIGDAHGWGIWFAYLSGFAAVMGHNFPVFFGFRGGKGILTSLALSFMIDWRGAVVALIVFFIVVIITRYVSLGSVLGCAANAVAVFVLPGANPAKVCYITFLAVIAIVKHKTNIKRLINGTENKIGQKK